MLKIYHMAVHCPQTLKWMISGIGRDHWNTKQFGGTKYLHNLNFVPGVVDFVPLNHFILLTTNLLRFALFLCLYFQPETVFSWMALVIPEEHQNGLIDRFRELDVDGGWIPELAKDDTLKDILALTDTQHKYLKGFAIKVMNRYNDKAYARKLERFTVMDADRAARFPLAIRRLKSAYLNGEFRRILFEFTTPGVNGPLMEHPDMIRLRDQIFEYQETWQRIWLDRREHVRTVGRDMAREIGALKEPVRPERLRFSPEHAEDLPHGCPLPPNTKVDDFWYWSPDTMSAWMALVLPQEHQNGLIDRFRRLDADGAWLPELAQDETLKDILALTDTQHRYLQGFAIKVMNRYNNRAYACKSEKYEKYVDRVTRFLIG
ncbi:hypothetical protein B9Z55_023591 [Caenorhabditis nigoni]|uniref:SAM domain-containing protein n=2 Tax=Caenorhabditis nigoni TaxID=1611254 RepID=A0A2G5SQV4_9PELO|nr:hypothetical protein B9Z55_023591 [Caenorhabditis nigoni]